MRKPINSPLSIVRLPLPLLLLSACADPSSATSTQDDIVEVAHTAQALEDDDQPIDTVTISAIADTTVRSLTPNRNFGSASSIDFNRGLVKFSLEDIKNARVNRGDGVASAKLRLTLTPTLLPRLQRNLEAHRVLKDWTESGATWNCAQDANTSNLSADCSGATKWSMTGSDAFVSAATGTGAIPALGNGVVEIDVTSDVKAFLDTAPEHPLNFGWLLKPPALELLDLSLADIASKESATPPKLVLQMRRCNLSICDDGNICTDDQRCDPDGFCLRISPPSGATCDDNNECTVDDLCIGYGMCGGTDASTETPCGTGGHCDGNGTCIQP